MLFIDPFFNLLLICVSQGIETVIVDSCSARKLELNGTHDSSHRPQAESDDKTEEVIVLIHVLDFQTLKRLQEHIRISEVAKYDKLIRELIIVECQRNVKNRLICLNFV